MGMTLVINEVKLKASIVSAARPIPREMTVSGGVVNDSFTPSV